ncbi:MAG TPA: hypothetical protein VGK52_13755 [Polyangia bacterium]
MLHVERRDGGGVLKLMAADGSLPLQITITKEGAVLHLGRGLSVLVDGPVALEMEALSIHAHQGIDVKTDGPMAIRANGDLLTEGAAQTIVARKGNVDVTANDDVTLHGERIKMNC